MGGSIGQTLGTKSLVEEGKVDNPGRLAGSVLGATYGGATGPLASLMGGMAFGSVEDALKAQQNGGGVGAFNAGPEPTRPEFNSLLDPSTGLMKSQYQLKLGDVAGPNTEALNAYQQKALAAPGQSQWEQFANKQAQLGAQGQKSALEQQAASAAAQARSNLASKYGLSSGARERIAKQGARDQMMGQQNIGANLAQQQAGIATKGEEMRNQMLGQLPGMQNQLVGTNLALEKAKLEPQQFNVGQAINQNALKNQADLSKYQEQMKSYAAKQAGQAMRESGSGGKK